MVGMADVVIGKLGSSISKIHFSLPTEHFIELKTD